MKRSCISCVMAILAVVIFTSPSLAVMRALGTAEMTADSDSVITGEVEDVSSSWGGRDQGQIITRAAVRVKEVVRGAATSDRVYVEHLGGTVGNITMKVSDMPSFQKGQDVVLFLKRTKGRPGGEAYGVVGNAQGKYDVGADGRARKGGFTIAGPPPAEEVMDNDLPVSDLVEKIKAVK